MQHPNSPDHDNPTVARKPILSILNDALPVLHEHTFPSGHDAPAPSPLHPNMDLGDLMSPFTAKSRLGDFPDTDIPTPKAVTLCSFAHCSHFFKSRKGRTKMTTRMMGESPSCPRLS